MLVLSRKTAETIHIGSEVVIRVCSIQGGKVRLGIEAPNDIRIVRGELEIELDPDPVGRDSRQGTNKSGSNRMPLARGGRIPRAA